MKSNINFPVRTNSIKVLIAFFSCILFLALQSCEEKETIEEILVGTWNIKSERTVEFQNEIKTDDKTYNYHPLEGAFQFLEDGTGKVYRDGVVADTYIWYEANFDGSGYCHRYLWSDGTFSWEISDDIITIMLKDNIGGDAPLSVSFTVSDSILNLKFTSYDGEHWYEIDIDGGHYVYAYTSKVEKYLTLNR
jgi:hypothetical protein